jgi:flagellar motor protein MotB
MGEKKCPDCPPMGAPDWMVTYGDLMTLLLCFFVLLFSFSTMETKKFESLKESMRGAFGVMSGASTTMGTGSARKPPKKTDSSFDSAVAKVLIEVKKKKPPKEKLEMLFSAKRAATKALKLVSSEKNEVEEIVKDLEKAQSFLEDSSQNTSKIKDDSKSEEIPRAQAEQQNYSGGSPEMKTEPEYAAKQMNPSRSQGENYDPNRSDASKIDISAGRDQNLDENTGQQKSMDRQSGKSKPKKNHQDKENFRSEDKDNDFQEPTLKERTMAEYATLSGIVFNTSHDLNYAVFHFSENLLFEENSTELKEEAKEKIYKIFLDKYKEKENTFFQIEAHTDFYLPNNLTYKDTWNLAGARALSVLSFLLDETEDFDPARFSLVSFGAYQPKYQYRDNQIELRENRRLEVRMFKKP